MDITPLLTIEEAAMFLKKKPSTIGHMLRAGQFGDAARKAFLAIHRFCRVCYVNQPMFIHHMEGRQGELLLKQSSWLAVCFSCHNLIHNNSEWAIANGFTIKRS